MGQGTAGNSASGVQTRRDSRVVSGVEDKLVNMRLHIGDTMITHGLMQEITSLINKNATEREKFCRLLWSACTTAEEGSNTSSNALLTSSATLSGSSSASPKPLFELFQRLRLMPDGNSRSCIAHWLRHLNDADETGWVPVFVRNDVVGYIADFYAFQANTHVAPDTLALVASLLCRWSRNESFSAAMNSVDAFRPVLTRLKFTRVSSEERCNLVEAMRRCNRTGLTRNDAFDIVMKIALERDETVERTIIHALDILGDALILKPELVASFTVKHIAFFPRYFQMSLEVVGSAVRLLVTLFAADAGSGTLNGSSGKLQGLQQLSSSSSTGATVTTSLQSSNSKLSSEIRTVIVNAMSDDLLNNMSLQPIFLTQACCIAIHTVEHANSFVLQKQFALVLRRTSAHPRDGAVLIGLANLVLHLGTLEPKLVSHLALMGTVDCLTEAFADPVTEVVSAVIHVLVQLCKVDANVSIALCVDRKFHTLMKTIFSTEGIDERVTWSVVRVLSTILTPRVISMTNEILVQTVYSLLCQLFAACRLPQPYSSSHHNTKLQQHTAKPSLTSPTTAAASNNNNIATSLLFAQRSSSTFPQASDAASPLNEQILTTILTLLTDRCKLGPLYAENVLGQIPIDSVRQLVNCQSHPPLQKMCQELVEVIAHSSAQARDELTMLGCCVLSADETLQQQPLSSHRGATVTLTSFQRRWKKVCYVRKVSQCRSAMANLLRTTFMTRLEVANEEAAAFRATLDSMHGDEERIVRHRGERELFDEGCLRTLSATMRSEVLVRYNIYFQLCEETELKLRTSLRVEESTVRTVVAPQQRVVREEIEERVEESKEERHDWTVVVEQHTVSIGRIANHTNQRVAVSDAEAIARRGILRQEAADSSKFQFRRDAFLVDEEERVHRKNFEVLTSEERQDILSSFHDQLLLQIVSDYHANQDEIRQEWEARCAASMHQFERLHFCIEEDRNRRERERFENDFFAASLQSFYACVLRQVIVDEARKRAALLRQCVADSRSTATMPKLLLTQQCEEEQQRRAILVKHRLKMNILAEAWRSSLLLVLSVEELRKRKEMDSEYQQACVASKWELAFLTLVYDELASRNCVALQYFFTARNLVAPFVCVKLVDYQRRLLLLDTEKRTDLWIEEHENFFALLDFELREQQRHYRAEVLREQGVDHERLTQHFVSVTHVVKIRESAEKQLAALALQHQRHVQQKGQKNSRPTFAAVRR